MPIDEDMLDPELVARIVERFGAPSPARPGARAPGEEELDARRERVSQAADPALLERLAAHERRARELGRPPSLRARVRTDLAALDLAVWRLPEEGEELEYAPPEDVAASLGERVPQALLRDLHRPELHFGDIVYRPAAIDFDPVAGEGARAVRELMRRPTGAALVAGVTASQTAAREMAHLRARLAEPWERAAAEKPASPSLAGFADLDWFGGAGGYDPDQ